MPDDLIWLRDPARPPEVIAYLAAERDFHDRSTSRLRPLAERLAAEAEARVPEAWAMPSWQVAGARVWRRRPAGHEHEQLVRSAPDGSAESVLLDLDELVSGASFGRLGIAELSPDGRWLAWSLDLLGDERYRLRVRDLATGMDLDGEVADTSYGCAWAADAGSFLYLTVDHADRPHRVWRHRIGRPFTADELVLEETDERFHLELRTSGDGAHALVRAASRLTAEEWLIPLADAGGIPASLLGRIEGVDYTADPTPGDAGMDLVAVITEPGGDDRVVRGRWADGRLDRPDELVPAAPGRRARSIAVTEGRVVLTGRADGGPRVWILDPGGSTAPSIEVAPTAIGASLQLDRPDAGPGTLCLVEESRTAPAAWSSLAIATGQREPLPSSRGTTRDDPRFLTERHIVPAPDRAGVPITMIRHRDTPLDGTAPCLLYGYGAWEHVIHPAWDPVLLSLLERGVVFIHAHIRGGGELGRDWWRAGRMDRKQQSFSDFITVADAIATDLVDGSRIVARGLSAGGLLMGAVFSQAPRRWAGVVAEVPFVDPVTTMSDPDAPLVIVERDEWGDPRRPEDLAWMLAWSPYDTPPPAEDRPRLLVTSALHDPRVSVWEPARWVARLRHTGSTDARVLFRVDLGPRGHWPPPGRRARIAYEAEVAAWILDVMGMA